MQTYNLVNLIALFVVIIVILDNGVLRCDKGD